MSSHRITGGYLATIAGLLDTLRKHIKAKFSENYVGSTGQPSRLYQLLAILS